MYRRYCRKEEVKTSSSPNLKQFFAIYARTDPQSSTMSKDDLLLKASLAGSINLVVKALDQGANANVRARRRRLDAVAECSVTLILLSS
jgi:hypothetical protein